MRRRAVAAVALVALAAFLVRGVIDALSSASDPPYVSPSGPVVEILVGRERTQRVDLTSAMRDGVPDLVRVRALLAEKVPLRWVVRTGRATVIYRLDTRLALRAVRARGDRSSIRVAARPVASRIAAPVVAQALRNNCESAALEVLLATVGRRTPQLQLQAALPVSGAPDPVGYGPSRVWGDPELGYVGRPDGGGAAGGFGVFQAPVMRVAEGLGARLDNLSGRTSGEVVARVRSGAAVMVWIGLSDGPYGEWRSPAGRRVRVNFGEHTVVLNGVTRDGRLRVVNVLRGTRELWTRSDFEVMWNRLGRRAIGAPVDPASA
jgi:uncharacterized protein YvpB